VPDSVTGFEYHRVKVLLLGASGFIGRWVARSLCTQGASVYLVVRNRPRAREIFFRYGIWGEILEVDLGDTGAVKRLFDEIRPSITFNLAGYGVDPTERDELTAYTINAHLAQAICEAVAVTRDARWLGQDVIHVGSALEYGSTSGDLHEDAEADPTTLYGKSKLEGTRLVAQCCRAAEIKGLTARLFTVYGPGEHQGRLLPSLLATATSERPLPLTTGQQKRDFTYVAEIAEGLLRLGLSTAKPGEVVNLATGKLTSVRAFTETAAGELQIPLERLEFGALPTRAEEMNHSEVWVQRLRMLIGWGPTISIAEGIRQTLDFERRSIHGQLAVSEV
jgi:UDP-glucose 4-epimerase